MTAVRFVALALGLLAGDTLAATWELNSGNEEGLALHGGAAEAPGVEGRSLVLDGASVIELKGSETLRDLGAGFTFSVWFNPYSLGGEQQMIAGKNRYSLGEREWGLIIEPDGKLRAYLRQKGWAVIDCAQPLEAGHWHQAVLAAGAGKAKLFLNGRMAGEVVLQQPLPVTGAPITLGGIRDSGSLGQTFQGGLDEARFEARAVGAPEIAAGYRPVTAVHEVPKPAVASFPLWDETRKLAEASDLPQMDGVEFHVIKKWDKKTDGYNFLHGVGLVWHRGKLFASMGINKGDENTVTEEARYRVSEDGGRTWGELGLIDAGDEENLAISHGVFASHAGTLWAFHGAYYGHMERIHMRAYSFDEPSGKWRKHGVMVRDGFWPLNQPVKMADGNWILPGISANEPLPGKGTHPPAVVISHGDDLTRWEFVRIPTPPGMKMWGESGVMVDGPQVVSVARYGRKALALTARSTDYGRTWTTLAESNLPMTTSKPAAGLLSTGQRYLVCTTAANNGRRRAPLTIAVSQPGEEVLSNVFVIRRALHPGQPGESVENGSLSYPCATEYQGKLYVGFSNNGGRRGNLNSAELAVIPVAKLGVQP